MKKFISLLSLCIMIVSFAQVTANEIQIKEWLKSGNIAVNLPVSNDDKDINLKAFDSKTLLQFDNIDVKAIRPSENEYSNFSSSKWQKIFAGETGNVVESVTNDDFSVQYYVAYIEASRFLQAKLTIESNSMLEVYLNGESKGGIYSFDEDSKFEKSLKFEKRNYKLVLKVLSKKDVEIKFSASLKLNDGFVAEDIKVWTNPQHYMDIEHVLEGPRIRSIDVSADGEYFIAKYSEAKAPEGKTDNWFEVRKVEGNQLLQTVRNHNYRSIQWLPYGHHYSYISGSDLWVSDAGSGVLKNLAKGLGASRYTWSNDGSFIIYSKSESAPKKNEFAQKFENMQDHWPWWRSRSFLYKFDVKTGLKQRLTFGNLSTDLHDICKDGTKLLYSESVINNEARPFSKQYLYELNLNTLELDTIWVKSFGGSVIYSPNGKQLLVSGSPAMFGDIGLNLVKQELSNNYDNQAYIYTIDNKEVKAITRTFDPQIEGMYWVDDNTIYFEVEEKTYSNLYEYSVSKDKFKLIETSQDLLSNVSFSKDAKIAGYTSHGVNNWNKGYLLNLDKKKSKLVADPEKEFFKDVKFGKIKDWVYTNEDGTELDGFIYYPPEFNPEEKYPVIVYYYAGTSPINKGFRGRYPKELYTAHGYIVYVVNPSGATGYGQEFSAAHVNNWGITVADEIIDATKYFVANHEYVNADKIGCMGASYGGFMTMLLMTKTDVFATGISHAGISSISSYWGEGYWGYLYNSTAAANSYPWNNKKLYVDQSALFNADKQENSILLLHGGSDTNVPVGESIQHFAALRLLGKEVEFVNIPGEDHWILNYKKRIVWQKTIAAWFDKELKDQDEWWNDLYPDPNLK